MPSEDQFQPVANKTLAWMKATCLRVGVKTLATKRLQLAELTRNPRAGLISYFTSKFLGSRVTLLLIWFVVMSHSLTVVGPFPSSWVK
jgi:hypothetical protein